MRFATGKGFGFLTGWAFALSGCSMWTAERSPESVSDELPSEWSATARQGGGLGVDQAWIARFQDPQLIRLVEEAMNENLDLKATAERVRRAEAVARLSGAARAPQVSAQLNTLQQKQRFPYPPCLPTTSTTLPSQSALTLDLR